MKHRLAVTASPIQNTDEDIGLIYVFMNNPLFFDSLEAGKNVIRNAAFLKAINEVNNHCIIIFPESIEKREFVVRKVIVSVPLSSEMSEYIGKNEAIFNNEHHIFSFLSCPESLYYYNSSEKSSLPCLKADVVNMIIDSAAKDDKIIIFSHYIDVLNSYYERLKKRGYNALIITGKDRGETKRKISQFRHNPVFRILLTTLFKSAEGLNLEMANHIIILEFWWNPQKVFQAMGRIDRRIQKKDCFIYLLCYNENGSIYAAEAKYLEVMKKKIDYARAVIPLQEGIPEIKIFHNENTFVKDFSDFLTDFKQIKENKSKIVNEVISMEQSKENHNRQEYNQKKLDKIYYENIIQEALDERIKEITPPINFDNIKFDLE